MEVCFSDKGHCKAECLEKGEGEGKKKKAKLDVAV
jgi:hypothetical protein